MRFENCGKNVLIIYELTKNGADFNIYVNRTEFDKEFIDSCKEFCKYAFDIEIQDFRGENKYFIVTLVMSQVRRSNSYDLAFTVSVKDKVKTEADCKRFESVIYGCIANFKEKREKEQTFEFDDANDDFAQFITDALAIEYLMKKHKPIRENKFSFNKSYLQYVSDVMKLDMHTDEPDFCPDPDELMEEDDCVHYVPNMTMKSMKIIRDGDAVFIEQVIGHDIVTTRLI